MNKSFLQKIYPWVICFAGLLVVFVTTGLCNNTLSVYLPYIQAAGITSVQGSFLFTIRSATSMLAIMFIDKYYEKLGVRLGLLLGLLADLLCVVFNTIGGSVWMYYIAAVLSGIGFGFAGFVPLTLLLNNWFSTRRGLAFGISALGSGVASIIFPSLVTEIAESSGLRSAFVLELVVVAVSILVIALLIRSTPESMGLQPYSGAEKEKKITRTSYDTFRPSDWIYVIPMLLFYGASIGSAIGHISIVFTSTNYPAAFCALLVSLFGIFQILGKLLYGSLSDHVGAKFATGLCMSFCTVGFFATAFLDGTSKLPCFLFVVLFGLGFAPAMSGISLWCNDLASGPQFPKTLKWMQFLYSLGCALFSSLPGVVFARTGEYLSSFLGMGVLQFLTGVLLILLYRANEKRRA